MPIRRHPLLFELSAWPWLDRLSRKAGRLITLGNVPEDAWDAYAAQGFDVVYLMGVWQRSAIGRELARGLPDLRAEYDRVLPGWTPDDVPGSPYSISEYVPDERMGAWAGLDSARAALHSRGMQLMVDFVPNHTAFDHSWTRSHPERYVLASEEAMRQRPDAFRRVDSAIIACGRDPYFAPWTDVAQLNYFNPDTRTAMLDVLRTISTHADGVRCDMAMLVLNEVFERTWRPVLKGEWPALPAEFWPDATREVDELLYVAEAYWDLEWTLQRQGFDFTYDKRLLDRLREGGATEVRSHLQADPAFSERLARFIENHDESRSAAELGNRLPAAATMVATLPGMRFFFDGQMDGARRRSPVQLGRWPDEPASLVTRELYHRLFELTRADVFHNGAWHLLRIVSAGNESHSHLIAWQWTLGAHRFVIVVNLGNGTSDGHVELSNLPAGSGLTFVDRLTGERYEWDRRNLEAMGLYVRLEAGQSHVLTMEVSAIPRV
ncbi:MAG: alpha-amylase family glycosyl hydrolase [Chloroflexota bacterium]|nr:alpha-amylase [Acidobacteriota bacterium]MDQ3525047.1 alpha-amylase family glycosyl hydrolase [Chloroflexota bacterium]